MKKFLILGLLLASLSAGAQVSVPWVLTQRLERSVSSVSVYGDKEVTVVIDTANYVAVVTWAPAGDTQAMRRLVFPSGQLTVKGAALTIGADFPYTGGIQVHLNTEYLELRSYGTSRLVLKSNGETAGSPYAPATAARKVQLQQLLLEAHDTSSLEVSSAVSAQFVTLRHDPASRLITPSYRIYPGAATDSASRPSLSQATLGGDAETSAFRNDHVVFFPSVHALSLGAEAGFNAWNDRPFGGFSSQDNAYAIKGSVYTSLNVSRKILRTRHFTLDFGIGALSEMFDLKKDYVYSTSRTTGNGTEYSLTSGAPTLTGVDDSSSWRSTLTIRYVSFPIRLRYNLRPDGEGWHFGVELTPAFCLSNGARTGLMRRGEYNGKEGDMISMERDQTLNTSLEPMRWFMKFTVGYSGLYLFAATSLTPIFKTDDGLNKYYFDRALYTFSIGIGCNVM